MKIAIIGAGNVGSLTALRLAQEGVGEILLLDIVKGLALGKAMDLEDARPLIFNNYKIRGTNDIAQLEGSDIIIITAGLPRKPGMTREELLKKNCEILKDASSHIKKLAAKAIVIVVTNPLDLMTYFVLKSTGFSPTRVMGMGSSLDTARFANLISQELNVPVADIDACVIASHGEGMLPLVRLTRVKGIALDELLDDIKIEDLVKRTVSRGLEIVTLLGSGSAYFAPSAAIASLVKAIIKDEKRTVGVSAYLNGEYAVKDVCIGVPCRLGKEGIEKIIELDLNNEEKEAFHKSASSIRELIKQLNF
ncbi:MAG: malate dehydrogenase [Candidatus Omnitrophota bacterium]